MMSFSERAGLQSLKSLSADTLEPSLRNRLWNVIRSSYFSSAAWSPDLNAFVERLWDEYFKWPQDSIPYATVLQTIRDYYFHAEWNQVYDFLEFCPGAFPSADLNARFVARANAVFVQELAPYRFLGQRLVRVSSSEEFEAIEQALANAHPLESVQERLRRALDLLADRHAPDYEASIRESLEALAALERTLSGRAPKFLARMADAVEAGLPSVERSRKPSRQSRIWSGLGQGRDAGREEAHFDDAKFALVVCSAAVNYALGKAVQADSGLSPEPEAGFANRAKAQA